MEALEALLTRRSVRAYEERMPEQDLIDKVMEAGLYAASGKNMQTAIIVEVTNKEVRDRLSVINAEIMGVTSDPFNICLPSSRSKVCLARLIQQLPKPTA